MQSVKYNDVSFILDNVKVWCDGHERYWYQKAWSILEQKGATEYSTQKEYYKKLLYACALVYAYDEFCSYAFEENSDTFFPDYLDDEIPSVVIGQILAEYFGNDDVIEDEDEAIKFILHDLRYEVFRFIRAGMSELDVFYWMYCTAISTDDPVFPVDDEDEADTHAVIESFEDYNRFVESAINAGNEDISGDQMAAFDFVCQLM